MIHQGGTLSARPSYSRYRYDRNPPESPDTSVPKPQEPIWTPFSTTPRAAHTPNPVRPLTELLMAFQWRTRPAASRAAEAQPSLVSADQLETINPT